MGTEYQKYLRPITLFGTKFESYLNQLDGKCKKQNKDDDFFKTLGGTMYEQAGNSEIDHNNQGFLSLEFNGNE